MPYTCCVAQCKSTTAKNKNLKFHNFPKDELLKKRWLMAINSGNQPTNHWKICSKHFSDECYTVTSLGQWKILNQKTSIPTLHLPETFDRIKSVPKKIDEKRDKNGETDQLHIADCDPDEMEVNEEISQPESSETSVHKLTDESVQTVLNLESSQLVSAPFLNESQLKHMTGLSRNLFDSLRNSFGKSYVKVHNILSVEDELLLTLMKYKLNLEYLTLSHFFGISLSAARRIFEKWTNHLNHCFKNGIKFCISASKQDGQHRIILDCTEFEIEKNEDPVIQQATYSTDCGRNIFKVMVGCTESGQITYVSKIYGGSVSNRGIVTESGFLDLLGEGDIVLAGAGLEISDLLEPKGVRLNILPFKKKKQLTEEDHSKAIAKHMIVMKNLIEVAKKNKILSDCVPPMLFPHFNDIVYNCFMLTSFKPSVIKKR